MAKRPTKNKPKPSKSDLMATLKLYVDLANSERQAIWARQATMVVGNTILINAITRSPSESNGNETGSIFSAIGILLCLVWAVMNWNGWTWFYKFMKDANKLPVDPSLNPFNTFSNLGKRRTDTIFICAMLVISFFACVYIVLLWPSIQVAVRFLCGR